MKNNGYYQNPIFPSMLADKDQNMNTSNEFDTSIKITSDNLEQFNIESILRLNKGKKAKFYVTIPGSSEWQNKVFEGIIEQMGKDYIIISNPNGEWYLIRILYLGFVVFDEAINFN